MSKQNLSGRFKSKRIAWTDEELRLTLGYYYFIYENNTREHDYEIFTTHLRSLTGNNRSFGSVGVRFGNFNSVNPTKTGSGFKGGDKKCKPIWDACINPDNTPKESFIVEFMAFVQKYGKCNKIYSPFIKKYKKYQSLDAKAIDDDDKEDLVTTLDLDSGEQFDTPSYKPEAKPAMVEASTKRYARDSYKAKKAIYNSHFKCDIDSSHDSFITKSGSKYMEAHHLIPMGAQDNFNVSLDVDANIVSLCPNCHRKLHHGADIEADLLKLFNQRKKLLEKSGIKILFEELKKYYE